MDASSVARLNVALAGRYTLEREIGRGATGVVWLAQQHHPRRHVALKMLDPTIARVLGPERFLREVDLAAKLTHPHILPIHAAGEAGGLLYYTMPYVEGESLRDRLNRERQLPLDDALQIAREVADALSYAHQHDVVHRDIKPENILLEAGHAVVADFGIARAMTEAGGQQLTETGIAVGTPPYMSPEQVAGSKDLDGRSDLYSLGCVLYEMLAGRPPFVGPTVESVVHQHIAAEPQPITSMRPAVPAAVAAALARSLAKTPADRFNPVALFGEALRVLPVEHGQTTPAQASRERTLPIGVTVGILLASAGLLFWLLRPRAPPVPVPGRSTQVTLDPGLELDPALSPDGSMVAYAAGLVGQMRIFVRRTSGGPPVALSSGIPGDHRHPRWSPDGARIAFEGSAGVFIGPVLGGTPNRLFVTDTTYRGSLAWSPDGRYVAYVGIDRVYRRSIESGETKILAEFYNPHSLVWSPDGSRLAVVSDNGQWVTGSMWRSPSCQSCGLLYFANVAPSSIWTVPSDSGAPVLLTDDASMNMSPVWLPNGDVLFVSDREGNRDIYWLGLGGDGRPGGAPLRLTTGLDAHTISVSASGTTVAYSRFEPQTNVWAIDIPSRAPVSGASGFQVTRGNQMIEGVGVTTDGRWLAFDSDRAGNQDIYKVQLPDGDPIQLTTRPEPDYVRAWSWDGQFVSGHAIRAGQRDPILVSADGARFEFICRTARQERNAFLAPDGRRVVFDFDERVLGERKLMIAERGAAGEWGEARVVTPDGGQAPAWSPDGGRILYLRDGGIWVLDPDGGEKTSLVAPGHGGWSAKFVAWAPNGRSAYYMAQDVNGRMGLWSVTAVGGPPRMLVLFDDPSRAPSRAEFAVDGRRFYFTLPGHQSDIWTLELALP